MTTENTIKFLTVKETADLLRLCTASVYAMIERHELPALRCGSKFRLPTSGVDKWVRDNIQGME